MVSMASSSPATRSTAENARDSVDLQTVAALPAGEQLLLQLISVIYEPVSAAFLTKCLAALDPPPVANRRLGEGDVSEMVARLRRKGLRLPDPHGRGPRSGMVENSAGTPRAVKQWQRSPGVFLFIRNQQIDYCSC